MFIKLCSIRDIYKAIGEFEQQFHKQFHVHFSEAMIMCILSEEANTAEGLMKKSGIAERLILNDLQTLEDVKMIEKTLLADIQAFSYALTDLGEEKIHAIKTGELPLSDMLERLILVADIFEKE